MGNGKKSASQLLTEAKGHFGSRYAELLKMKDVEPKTLDDLIERIKKYVKAYVSGVSTSQLRNIYSKIKPLKEKDLGKLKLERPKLAYIIARQNKQEAIAMMLLIDDLMKDVNTKDELENFQSFMESVVAYHKYFDKVE